MPSRLIRSRLPAVASLIVAGTFALAATSAAGLEPGQPTPIPESVFQPVSLPSSGFGPAESPTPNSSFPALAYPWLSTELPDRAQPSIAPAKPIVVTVPTATPTPTKAPAPAPKLRHSISGPASWYCRAGWSPCTAGYPDDGGVDAYAAAGPKLRAAIGSGWRGKVVLVDGMRVRLIDWCQCYRGQPNEKLLDLYHDVYARVGGSVTIRW